MEWIVTLTRDDFDAAKKGEIVFRGAFVNPRGVLGLLFLSNKDMSEKEIKKTFYGVLANNNDVYYVNVSEWEWEQLDKPELDRIPHISFSDGVGFVFISIDAKKRLEVEV